MKEHVVKLVHGIELDPEKLPEVRTCVGCLAVVRSDTRTPGHRITFHPPPVCEHVLLKLDEMGIERAAARRGSPAPRRAGGQLTPAARAEAWRIVHFLACFAVLVTTGAGYVLDNWSRWWVIAAIIAMMLTGEVWRWQVKRKWDELDARRARARLDAVWPPEHCPGCEHAVCPVHGSKP